MTPFAAEISRNLSRFMRNKIRLRSDMEENDIMKNIIDYFSELYPGQVYSDNKGLYVARVEHRQSKDSVKEIVPILFSCYIVDEIEKTIEMSQQEEEEGAIGKLLDDENTIVTIKKIKKEVSAHIVNIKTNSPEDQKHAFIDGVRKLYDLIHFNRNIYDGFVCFLTNKESLWPSKNKNDNKNIPDNIAILQDIRFDQLTLLPRIEVDYDVIKPFQAVWLATRNRQFNFCLGMFDAFFDSKTYPCKIRKCIAASEFNLSKLKQTPIEAKIDVKSLSPEERFYQMLKEERFVKNTKGKDWLWEWENSFLNDYSRLTMSPAIRRMKDKTQVFSFEESDFHRVRLTHSLEVANVARLMGLGIEHTLKKGIKVKFATGDKHLIKFKNICKYHIPQILEVAGLIHDIGNPPFGHFGEGTIQAFFRDPSQMHPEVRKQFDGLDPQQQADFKNFDGNVQGFRILRHLGLSTDCSSFNLNKAVVSSLIKYPFSSEDGNDKNHKDCRRHKFGYFQKEEEAYRLMRESLLLEKGQRHPLAYIIEAADDISYMGSDIEDGWKLKYIAPNDIIDAYSEKLSDAEKEEIFKGEWQELKERIKHPDQVISAHAVQAFRIRMQRYMVKEVVNYFCKNVERIVTNQLKDTEHEIIENIPTVKKLHDIWKLLVQNCYNQIHGSQIQGGQILTALLKCFTETVFCGDLIKYKDCDPSLRAIKGKLYTLKLNTNTKSGMVYETISDNYRYELSPAGQYIPQDAYDKFLLVTDFVSGMTDCYATSRYEALML